MRGLSSRGIISKFLIKQKKRIIASIIFCGIIAALYTPSLSRIHPPHSTIILDRNRHIITEITPSLYKHTPITTSLPDDLNTRVVQREDRRFWYHRGVDPLSIVRGLWQTLANGNPQGGSTIQSQIVKNILRINEPRTRTKKVVEFWYATSIGLRIPRKKILTDRANTVPFAYQVQGFGRASYQYYNTGRDFLNPHQRFGLFVMSANGVAYDPYRHPEAYQARYAKLHARCITNTSCQDSDETNTTIAFVPQTLPAFTPPRLPNRGGYVRDYGISQGRNDPVIHSTLDMKASDTILSSLRQNIGSLVQRNVSDGAVLVIDHTTQEVVSFIGGVDFDAPDGGQVNAILARNQPGSALKPFTYLGAVIQGRSMDDTVMDIAKSYQTQNSLPYEPKNIDLQQRGAMTLAHALATSRNIPAVELANELGLSYVDALYANAGLNLLADTKTYGLAITLGAPDVRLRDLVHSYGIFVHQGKRCSSTMIKDGKTICDQRFDPNAIKQIDTVLRSRALRRKSFPLYGPLDFADGLVGLKSGTSRNFSDNRLILYTDKYLIGIWIGNKDGSAMKGVTGSIGAGDLARAILTILQPQIVNQDHREITPLFDRSVGFDAVDDQKPLIIAPLPGKYQKTSSGSKLTLSAHLPIAGLFRRSITDPQGTQSIQTINTANNTTIPLSIGSYTFILQGEQSGARITYDTSTIQVVPSDR